MFLVDPWGSYYKVLREAYMCLSTIIVDYAVMVIWDYHFSLDVEFYWYFRSGVSFD